MRFQGGITKNNINTETNTILLHMKSKFSETSKGLPIFLIMRVRRRRGDPAIIFHQMIIFNYLRIKTKIATKLIKMK